MKREAIRLLAMVAVTTCTMLAAPLGLTQVRPMDLFGNTPVYAAETSMREAKVTVDGEQVYFAEQQAVVIDGTTLIPVRGVFEKMGWLVDWDQANQAAMLKKDKTILYVPIGRDRFLIREEGKEDRLSDLLAKPAQLINEKTMIPLRAVAEATGAVVDWDQPSFTAIILTQTQVAAATPPPAATPAPSPAPSGTPAPSPAPSTAGLTQEEIDAGWTVDQYGRKIAPPPVITSTTPTTTGSMGQNSTRRLTEPPVPFGQDAHPDFVPLPTLVLTQAEIDRGKFIDDKEKEADHAFLGTLSVADFFVHQKYQQYVVQEQEKAQRAANVAAGLPATAMWDPTTGIGKVDIMGKTIYLGEMKTSIETKFGRPSYIEDYAGDTEYCYEFDGGLVRFTYSMEGRLIRIHTTIPGYTYNGRSVGANFNIDTEVIKTGEKIYIGGGGMTQLEWYQYFGGLNGEHGYFGYIWVGPGGSGKWMSVTIQINQGSYRDGLYWDEQ